MSVTKTGMDNAKRTSGCSSVKISSGLPSTEEDQSTIEIILYDGLEEETFSGQFNSDAILLNGWRLYIYL